MERSTQAQSIYNQSWLDITVQNTGTLQALFEVAKENSVSITQSPIPGTFYTKTPVRDRQKKRKLEGRTIGTAGTNGGGIGFWIIEFDFKPQ